MSEKYDYELNNFALFRWRFLPQYKLSNWLSIQGILSFKGFCFEKSLGIVLITRYKSTLTYVLRLHSPATKIHIHNQNLPPEHQQVSFNNCFASFSFHPVLLCNPIIHFSSVWLSDPFQQWSDMPWYTQVAVVTCAYSFKGENILRDKIRAISIWLIPWCEKI